jgi:hypothetical protein
MSETFKVEEFERTEKKEDSLLSALVEKKKVKFEKFDEITKDVESGNWRVLQELEYY